MNRRHGLDAKRRLIRAGAFLAPSLAARLAVRRLYTLPRRVKHSNALPPGGTPFTARFDGHAVRGFSWGEGPVVYLVHGWAGGAGQWAPLIPRLSNAGFRAVTFDGPSHGQSDPGPLGAGRSNGVELGRALDAVAAVHGPAHTVVAHSLGATATMLTLRFGWLSTSSLVFVAPMCDLRSQLDQLGDHLGLGHRARVKIDLWIQQQTGIQVDACDILGLSPHAERAPLLVVHDLHDPRAPLAASTRLVRNWPARATLVMTDKLGHTRLLAAPPVHDQVLNFIEGHATSS